MRVRLSVALFVLLSAVAGGCAPSQKCSGLLYYDPSLVVCRACPKGSTFKDGTCECKQDYEFDNNRCVLKDGAMPDISDAGPDTGSSLPVATCATYCDFANVCIGDNTLATTVLPDIVSGLHADDTSACAASCKSDLGADGSSDPVLACIDAGRLHAMCAGDSSATGLASALGLVGDCCRSHQDDALCGSICKTLKANALASSMVDFCK